MIRSLCDVTTAAPSVAEETLPWQPGLAMVHFRLAGSEASDRVAAVLAQIVEAGARRLPLTEVDVDDRPQLAARYNVRATPSVLLLRDGSVVDRVIGDASRTLLQSLLDARAAESGCRGRTDHRLCASGSSIDVKHHLAAPLNVGDRFTEGREPIGRCDRYSDRA